MGEIKKRKKYRLNAKFYCWIFIFGILMILSFSIKSAIQFNTVPNFHGWSAESVMKYDKEHENITIIYELVYSYDILQNRVMDQSIKPRTPIGEDPLVLTVTVSKGIPVMDDFTGQSVNQVLEFAEQYNLTVHTLGSGKDGESQGVVAAQSIAMGETLSKNSSLEITLSGQEVTN